MSYFATVRYKYIPRNGRSYSHISTQIRVKQLSDVLILQEVAKKVRQRGGSNLKILEIKWKKWVGAFLKLLVLYLNRGNLISDSRIHSEVPKYINSSIPDLIW